MTIEDKNLEDVNLTDVLELIGVAEGRKIDFKEQLPGNTEGDKKEFLADICSFANSLGGHIIYGIREVAGVATEVVGLAVTDTEQEKLRLEHIILNGLDPRIQGTNIVAITLDNTRPVIIIRIKKSYMPPHAVNFAGRWRVYARNSNGKIDLDMSEVRSLVLQSSTLSQKIRDFRLERISNIGNNEAPVILENRPKLVLHVIPITAFDSNPNYNLDPFLRDHLNIITPFGEGITRLNHNFDGIISAYNYQNHLTHSYIQIFKNGIIEAVSANFTGTDDGIERIRSIAYERDVIEELNNVFQIFQILQVNPPIIIMMSLLDVKGCGIYMPRLFWDRHGVLIDRENLLMPDIMVNSFDELPANFMKSTFDTVWQSVGLSKSYNYNDEGQWAPRER